MNRSTTHLRTSFIPILSKCIQFFIVRSTSLIGHISETHMVCPRPYIHRSSSHTHLVTFIFSLTIVYFSLSIVHLVCPVLLQVSDKIPVVEIQTHLPIGSVSLLNLSPHCTRLYKVYSVGTDSTTLI